MYQPLNMLLPAAVVFSAASAAVMTPTSIATPTPAASNPQIGKTVNTTSGMLVGHPNAAFPAVSEYLGVPFAQPPLKDLRFAPPKPYNGTKKITACEQPLSCMQRPSSVNASQPKTWQNIASIGSGSYANHTSEDCLYMNIWTKFPFSGATDKKPVLVWIYGGGFHSGGASDIGQQGAIFAEQQDVVAVNFNYRLGIFGFSGAPGQTQNVGLLDQRMAVEWVRDNIAAFGGDPSRITIFGHSAGGASVDYYNYAWTEDPIIAGSMSLSGSTTNFGNREQATTQQGWSATAELLKCGNSSTTSSTKVLSCMQSASPADLFKASLDASKSVTASLPATAKVYVGITGLFGPTIDNKTVFQNYTVRGHEGKFIKRPFVTGSNNDEACFFSMGGSIPVSEDPVVTDLVFTCPMDWAAKFRAAAGVPAWKYRYFASYPNQEAPICPGQPWHGSDQDVWWGNTANVTGAPDTRDEINMGWYLRDAWAAFAHDPTSGLQTNMGWPLYKTNENNVIELGTNTTLMTVGDATADDMLCGSVFANGAPNF